MYKKWMLVMLILTIVIIQPDVIFAADKPVSDCLNDEENCMEEPDESETNEEDTKSSSNKLLDDDAAAPSSLGLNIIKMVFALLLILALIYTLLWFLKKRRSYEKAGALENVGGISVGQQKSVQIIRIGDTMYLLGVGNNVELLKELSKEEAENIQADLEQSTASPAGSFIQDTFHKWNKKNATAAQKPEEKQMNASFKQELDRLKATRHQMMDDYNKKDDEHE